LETYHVKLQSEVFKTFRCVRAANSLDIDADKKSIHELKIEGADITSPFNIGLILGASGSGKTTLAKQIYGDKVFESNIDFSKPVIDQFPEEMSYDDCASTLSGIGLTSVPCWIRPIYTLSNGQRARAEAALALISPSEFIVIDEWTSVVDRTVAKVMSHCVQKLARRTQKKIVLLSCHYDVVEWLNPDWIIDCNKQQFIDRRLLRPEERSRREKLTFSIQPVDNSCWKNFSKYHYLSNKLASGRNHFFGLFENSNQIGFIAFTNYVPWKDKSKPMIMHANRIVVHPDYAGMGLGSHLLNETASHLRETHGYEVMIKFSSIPMLKHLLKDSKWRCINQTRQIGIAKCGSGIGRSNNPQGFRHNVKTWTFKLK
jgi:ABC-type lipoprotein export system ATPase subunit